MKRLRCKEIRQSEVPRSVKVSERAGSLTQAHTLKPKSLCAAVSFTTNQGSSGSTDVKVSNGTFPTLSELKNVPVQAS